MPDRIENSERVRVPGGVRAARVAERKTFDGSDGRTFGEDYETPPLSDAQQAEVSQATEEQAEEPKTEGEPTPLA